MIFIYALLATLVVSLVSFSGLLVISWRAETLRRVSFILVSLAVGALLGDTFFHIIPEVFAEGTSMQSSFLIVGGILVFFVLEKFIHWHHHGHDETEHAGENPRALGKLVLISDGFHNFLDGIVIGTSFLVSVEVGIATTIAVMLHEIPQEVGDFGVLLHAGHSKFEALWFNFLSALTSFIGVGLVFVAQGYTAEIAQYALPLTAGMFLYIATSDLVPELHKHKGLGVTILQILAIGLGVFAMYLLVFFE